MRKIAKIDVKSTYVIKSIQYDGGAKIGEPIGVINKIVQSDIDELFLVNIVSTLYGYDNFRNILDKICSNIFLPITVGGGIRSIEDCISYFELGADKISINSNLFTNKGLLGNASKKFGSQSVSVLIQAKKLNNEWYAFKDMARHNTGVKVKDWILQCAYEGAGEIILVSVDDDGLERGLNKELMEFSKYVDIPVVIGGGFNYEKDNKIKDNFKKLSGISFSSYLYNNKL